MFLSLIFSQDLKLELQSEYEPQPESQQEAEQESVPESQQEPESFLQYPYDENDDMNIQVIGRIRPQSGGKGTPLHVDSQNKIAARTGGPYFGYGLNTTSVTELRLRHSVKRENYHLYKINHIYENMLHIKAGFLFRY